MFPTVCIQLQIRWWLFLGIIRFDICSSNNIFSGDDAPALIGLVHDAGNLLECGSTSAKYKKKEILVGNDKTAG